MSIEYSTGRYSAAPKKAAAGETLVYDLKQLRDEQLPDEDGGKLPLDVTKGYLSWTARSIKNLSTGQMEAAANHVMIGRYEHTYFASAISSTGTYGCVCQPSYVDGWIEKRLSNGSWTLMNSSETVLARNETVQLRARQMDQDCGGWDTHTVAASFGSDDSGVAAIGESGLVTGVDGGDATIGANWAAAIWYPLYECCEFQSYDPLATGQVRVVSVPWSTPGPVGANNEGGGVPLSTGTPPQGSIEYVNSTTITATGKPEGGTYQWSTTSNKVTLSNTTSNEVTVTAVSESNTTGDVTINVTYTYGGKSRTEHIPFTVQKPTFMDFISTGSGTAANCPSGESGNKKDIVWQVADKNHNPIKFRLPLYDTLTNQLPNTCSAPQQGEGTDPGVGTGTGGRWNHKYRLCSTACNNSGSCTVAGTQMYFVQGYEISVNYTMTCSSITVGGH